MVAAGIKTGPSDQLLIYMQKRTGGNYPKTIPACSFLYFLYIMMLGAKAFDPSDTELLCTACSRNSQKHSQFAHFSLKNGYLLMFLAGPKVKNSPASKLASNF